MKLRRKAERPSSFYRAPEIQERGRSLERDSNQKIIGLGISTPDEQETPDTGSREWSDEEMTEDPKIQNYSSRRPRLLIRRDTEKARPAVLPPYGDPVVAIQEVLVYGGVLLPIGREGGGLLVRLSTDQVRAVRETHRLKREGTFTAGRAEIVIMHEPCYLRDSRLTWTFTEKEKHDRELDQFVANSEQLQRETDLGSEEAEGKLDKDVHTKETKFESVPNTDGAQESKPSQKPPLVDSPHHGYVVDSDSDSESDTSSSAGSDTSVRTAFRTRDRSTNTEDTDSLGKSHPFVAHPLPPVPTFPPSDFLEPIYPDDHEEFVSLNDPSITKHLADALRNIYSGDMAAQNPAMANSAAPYTLGGGMPSAGHHSDMQHIWSLVQELSSVLQQNREHYDELQDGLARAQVKLDHNDMGKMLGWLTRFLLDKAY
jgi:hypothetical protein